MGTRSSPPGFHQILRRDSMFEERVHDAYKAKRRFLNRASALNAAPYFMKGAGNGVKFQPAHTRKPVPLVIAYTTNIQLVF